MMISDATTNTTITTTTTTTTTTTINVILPLEAMSVEGSIRSQGMMRFKHLQKLHVNII